MKLYKSWLVPATYTIILVVTTYATSTEAAKQKQAEVNLQQVAVAPSRLLKYGDKTTKKIPNEEVLFLPTNTSIDKYEIQSNFALPAKKQSVSRHRPRSRIEHIELSNAQISRQYESGSQQNQLVVQHNIPIVQKNHELFHKRITPTVGQQRTTISNRSRSSNTLAQYQQQHQQLQLQPAQNSHLNNQSEKHISKTQSTTTATATVSTHSSRQRKAKTTSTSRTIPSANNYQAPLSSPNTNVRHTHHLTSNNSTIVSHHRSNQQHQNNNKPQPLLASSNAVDTSGLQFKTEKTSSNRQRGNITENKSVSSNSTSTIRSNIRKFPSNASTITIIPLTSTSTTTSK